MAKRFREARVKAGLPEDIVLYCGRHDDGTRILKRIGNLAAVMRTMGHKDVKYYPAVSASRARDRACSDIAATLK